MASMASGIGPEGSDTAVSIIGWALLLCRSRGADASRVRAPLWPKDIGGSHDCKAHEHTHVDLLLLTLPEPAFYLSMGWLRKGNTMRTILLMAPVIMALSACQQTGPDLAAAHDGECQSWGAKPGSESYVQCRAQLAQQEHQRRAAMAAYFAGKPVQLPQLDPNTVIVRQPPPPSPTNCTSQVIGDTMRTSCY